MYLVNIFTRYIVKINYFTSMKKFAFLLATLFAIFAVADVQAQKTANLKSLLWSPAIEDTAVNAVAREQRIPSLVYAPVAKIETAITRASGTVGGKVIASGSKDAVTWVKLDSATATNVASQTLHMSLGATNYWFYRVVYTGTGTMNARFRSVIKAK